MCAFIPPLRIDKGYLRGVLNLERSFITVIGVLVYYRYSERAYFSLFNDASIILMGQHLRKLRFFNFYFLNSDSSVTIYAIEMIFSESLLKVPSREACLRFLI